MTAVPTPGARSPVGPGSGTPPGARAAGAGDAGPGQSVHPGAGHDLWPRDFGRDGVSGLVSPQRAMRARDVSRPDPADERMAAEVLDELLARVDGRRGGRPRP